MKIKDLRSKYRKFGGFRALRHFFKRGLIGPMLKEVLRHPFDRQSYKKAYAVAVRDAETLLKERYTPLMQERKAFYAAQELEHKKSKVVWFCWLQGLEQAPPIVKRCHESLSKNLPDREVRVVDANNWRDYVDLPASIVRKWEQKQIPSQHFTDLLRLQFLIQHGGTWMDASVLCTGLTPQNGPATLSYLDADLFFFQYTLPGSQQWGGIGNWFITACTHNEVLLVLRDMLLAYWADYDCLIDYYMFHLFFSMLRDVFPEEIAAMPYGYAGNSIALGRHLGDPFDVARWQKVTAKVCFHKLPHTVRPEVLKGKDNYYHHLVDRS